MSKLWHETLKSCIKDVLEESKKKRRKLSESVQLQVVLKNYDLQKGKDFSGTIKLNYIPRPRMKICVLGNKEHCEEAKFNKVASLSIISLKKLKIDKKNVWKLTNNYDAFLVSESQIRDIPSFLSFGLQKSNKLSGTISDTENIVDKIDELKATVDIHITKGSCVSQIIGHVEMTPEELFQNIVHTIDFLVSRVNGWQHIHSIDFINFFVHL